MCAADRSSGHRAPPRKSRRASPPPVPRPARKLLLPEGHYVVIKRFSAKEEKRRVVAGVWKGEGPPVALDNKTNCLHVNKGPIDPPSLRTG